jgi:hypothetical protein
MTVISAAEFLRILEALVRDVLADEEETPRARESRSRSVHR